MSGPTREEVEIIESALLDFGDPDGPCNAGPYAKELCGKLDDLSRARHVREAVEGLSDKVIHETLAYIVDRDDGEPEWWWNDPAAFREALLAALTGEGK